MFIDRPWRRAEGKEQVRIVQPAPRTSYGESRRRQPNSATKKSRERTVLDVSNLSLDDIHRMKRLRNELLDEYHALLAEILDASDKSIAWLVNATGSRDPYINDLFRHCCYLDLIKSVTSTSKTVQRVIVPTRSLGRVLEAYFAQTGDHIEVVVRQSFRSRFIEGCRAVLNFCFLLRNLGRMVLSRSAQRRARLDASQEITLVDTFILPDSVRAGRYLDRYYPGMLEHLSEAERARVYFAPTVLDKYDKETFASLASRSPVNLLFKHDYLKVYDYLYALFCCARIRKIDFSRFRFREFGIAPLLRETFRRNRFHHSSILAILDYCFFKRLRKSGVRLRLVVDWFENQVIDHGFNKGLRAYYPKTPSVGYLGFTLSTDVIHYIMPAPYESALGVVPDEMAVTGTGLVNQPRLFDKELKVTVAPAFRARDVWQPFERASDGEPDVVLVALPITVQESTEIIRMVAEAVQLGQTEGVGFHIKPHPSLDMILVKGQLACLWPKEFEIVGGDFKSCLEKAGLLISSSSGTCLETLTRGIPVIVVGTQCNLARNPIPESVPGELWQVCCSAAELRLAIQRFLALPAERKRRFEEVGARIREEYFEPVTRARVREFLKLEGD